MKSPAPIREMAHHPAIVVWCGNNEIEEADWNWGYDNHTRTHPHYALFHHDFPKIVTQEDPSKVYWLSSPWSPDYVDPRDPTRGDQHPWKVSLGEAGGADFWHYRDNVDRFPNEGGVLGASTPAPLRQFLPEGERFLFSPSWQHHDNEFAKYDTKAGELGHAYQTVTLWTGRDPLQMAIEEYAYVSALLQAEGVTEYILNYRRRMFSSASAIFWMYNDSWPTTHSWTIVDYYLRKRLPYHPVRRAFAPITVVCARDGDNISFWTINETPEPWTGTLQFGPLDTQGRSLWLDQDTVKVAPNTVKEYEVGIAWKYLVERGLEKTGVQAMLRTPAGEMIAQHRALFARFHELDLDRNPAIAMQLYNGVLTLQSEVFVWGVCLDVDGERALADNCFDLLPHVPYSLPWPEDLGPPQILRTGNRDAL